MERYYEEIREHDPVDLNGLKGAENEDDGKQIRIIFLKDIKFVTTWKAFPFWKIQFQVLIISEKKFFSYRWQTLDSDCISS